MDDPTPLTAEIEVTIHDTTSNADTSTLTDAAEMTQVQPFFSTFGKYIRTLPANSEFDHDPE
jgi:hypothetical protein